MKKRKLFAFMLLLGLVMMPSVIRAELSLSAQNAVLMDMESGRVLVQKDAHVRRPIASITKIMTALLAVESGQLKETVSISDRARQVEGSSIYMEKGDKLTLEELVYGLMLRSGNDAATAISEYVGGSTEEFVVLMNEKAKKLGMRNTSFMNPHGLDDPAHYSTAYDMALLTAAAMKNETYRKIVSTSVYKTKSKPVRVWENKHRLVRNGGIITGGKTGFTKISGRTLVTTAKENSMGVVAVTLNAPNDWLDHTSLFDYAFSSYKQTVIVGKTPFSVPGEAESFYAKKQVRYPMTSEEKKSAYLRIVLSSNKKGTAELWIGTEKKASTPVYRTKSSPPSFWTKIKKELIVW
ncbi:D-alanyl-D-alanine carboxypeptidase [Domibacillus sp. A3M-37]|uniref:D-alanyl-D-alanine carboxypeptidase family protein n=1 Tax=Domibacillus TaxID=1433999 RepID=UPI000618049E|nr:MULTISPECIES: D-alanyl-D-alanine carboxypeptidase family protein [Domibacillus]MCP3763234.1 D-alanyl-D-alanine carboxypeptidase [Domibacillus sp. A3M-37]